MAIKGKQKGKSHSARAVPRGPRTPYVKPKAPLFQRTATKVAVVVVLEAAVFAILAGFDAQADLRRAQQSVTQYRTLVEASLFSGGVAQPLPAGALVLPEMGQVISTLGTEEADLQQIVTSADGWTDTAVDAAEGIAQVEAPAEGELEPEHRLALVEAGNAMRQGLLMYAGIAQQIGVAAQIQGPPQEQLIAVIEQELGVAAETFDGGYGKMQDVARQLDLSTSGSVPGGGFPGGGLPGGMPGGFPGGVPGAPGGIPVPGGEVPVPGEEPATDDGGGQGGGGGGQGGGGGGGQGGGQGGGGGGNG